MTTQPRSARKRIILAGLTVVLVIGASILGAMYVLLPRSDSPQQSGSTHSAYFDYLVVIVMENMGINRTYGNSCAGNCSYVTHLADTFGLAKNYSGVAHRSGPNYLTLTSGANYSIAPFNTDCDPQVNDCYITAQNIVDRIEGTGRTWRAYMEDYTGSGCSKYSSFDALNAYVNDHNPFLYYTDIYYNSTRCSNIVDANPGHEGYLALPSVLLSDLNDISRTPNFMWLSPNNCNNGHSTCNLASSNSTCTNQAQCVSQGNEYLSEIVPRILDSTVFRTRNATLFITWDEGNDCPIPPVRQTYPTCIDRIPAIFAGPSIKRGFITNAGYSHYSFVKTLEVAWNFSPLTPLDNNATPMNVFFSYASSLSSSRYQLLIVSDQLRV